MVVGDRVLTAYWRTQSDQGFYNNVARGGRIDNSPVPPVMTDLALQLARDLGVDHAGFDIALVDGHPYVLEFNRLFGNKGLGQGTELQEAILGYLREQTEPEDPDGPTEPPPIWPVAV